VESATIAPSEVEKNAQRTTFEFKKCMSQTYRRPARTSLLECAPFRKIAPHTDIAMSEPMTTLRRDTTIFDRGRTNEHERMAAKRTSMGRCAERRA
jgi:hypothetical protein